MGAWKGGRGLKRIEEENLSFRIKRKKTYMRFLNFRTSKKARFLSGSPLNLKRRKILGVKTSLKITSSGLKIVRKRITRAVRIVLISGFLSCSSVAFAADAPIDSIKSSDVKKTKLTYKAIKKLLLNHWVIWGSTGFFIGFFCPRFNDPVKCGLSTLRFTSYFELIMRCYSWVIEMLNEE